MTFPDGFSVDLLASEPGLSKVTNTEALPIGVVEFAKPGTAVLELELTGKNPAASDNKIGLDYLLLEPLDLKTSPVLPAVPGSKPAASQSSK